MLGMWVWVGGTSQRSSLFQTCPAHGRLPAWGAITTDRGRCLLARLGGTVEHAPQLDRETVTIAINLLCTELVHPPPHLSRDVVSILNLDPTLATLNHHSDKLCAKCYVHTKNPYMWWEKTRKAVAVSRPASACLATSITMRNQAPLSPSRKQRQSNPAVCWDSPEC